MTTPLLISDKERQALAMLRERAAANPVHMPLLIEALKTPDGKARHKSQMTAQSVALPAAFLVTFSIEAGHPVGTCRHMSMSVQRKGRLPNPQAVWLVAELLGFTGSLAECQTWKETLAGHGEAINVVQPVMPVSETMQ